MWFSKLAVIAVLVSAGAATAQQKGGTAATIIGMERAALDRWCKGDPDGFLEISAPEVVYFDPMQAQRLDGWEGLKRLYDGIRGKVKISHYEMLNPKVTASGGLAVLTFNFVSDAPAPYNRWNTTEVYQKRKGQWRIIHTHWSLTQPKLAGQGK